MAGLLWQQSTCHGFWECWQLFLILSICSGNFITLAALWASKCVPWPFLKVSLILCVPKHRNKAPTNESCSGPSHFTILAEKTLRSLLTVPWLQENCSHELAGQSCKNYHRISHFRGGQCEFYVLYFVPLGKNSVMKNEVILFKQDY